jgi:23S rRNA (uracil1939-C5)-methyltransferase
VVGRGCGGCDLQHADPPTQLAMKHQIVVDALRRLGRIAEPELLVAHAPALPGEGFRTTVRGAVDHTGRFAFRHRHSHELVAPGADRCLVAHPLLDELVVDGRFGSAGEVTLRVGAGTGERVAVIAPTVDSGALSVPPDVTVVGLDELRAGKRVWFHEVVHDRTFRISARSFFQSRPDGAAALVDAVRVALEPHDTEPPGADPATDTDAPLPIVDAYAGVGLFAAFLGDADRPVIAVERNRSSMADARANLGHVRLTAVPVDVERWRPSAASAVIADPSRDGLGRAAVGRLAATGARRLVLVSCDPAALGRDARLLGDAGYSLVRSTIVDLFPHTHHVEVVSRFDRIS